MTAVLAPACLGALLACAAAAQTAPLVVQDAWVRAAPGSDVAAAYLTVRNVSAVPVTITSVSSPVASHSMIHETSVESGQSRMRAHEQLRLAPGQTIKLEPGGLHVMLQGLAHPLTVGEGIPLVLALGGAGTLQVTAAVRPVNSE